MSKLIVNWNAWVVATAILFADAIASGITVALPLYFFEPEHFLEKGAWLSFGCSLGVLMLKTLGASLMDFKKYIKEIGD